MPGFGLSKAFSMNVDALRAFRDVQLYSLEDQIPQQGGCIYMQTLLKEAESLAVKHQNALRNCPSIGYFVWESSELPNFQLDFSLFDEIWTASTFCKQVLEAKLHRTVRVLPHVATRFSCRPMLEAPITFLTMFDGGSRLLRKNPFALVEAFKAAFSPADDVKLVVKVKNAGASFMRWVMNSLSGYNVDIVDGSITEAELEQLYQNSHCYVSTHCGEGFGLPMWESMAHSRPVIATNWSGNTDFLDHSNGFPVDFDLVDCEDTLFPGQWAKIKHDALVESLQQAAANPAQLAALGKSAFQMAGSKTLLTNINLISNVLT